MECFIIYIGLIVSVAWVVGKIKESQGTSQKPERKYNQNNYHKKSSRQTGNQLDDMFLVLDAAEHGVFFPGGEKAFDDQNYLENSDEDNGDYDQNNQQEEDNDYYDQYDQQEEDDEGYS